MASKQAAAIEDTPRSMREIVQKKFIDEVIGCARKCRSLFLDFAYVMGIAGWKVLVMDKVATRVISSALTMYDIMEKRVTLVEQLAKNRQPFPEMDVVYLVSPTMEAVQKICGDFESRQKAKYGSVHIFFLDAVSGLLLVVNETNGTFFRLGTMCSLRFKTMPSWSAR